MKKPNIFEFATKELSQDAFICWLASWAKKEYIESDRELHQLGNAQKIAYKSLACKARITVISCFLSVPWYIFSRKNVPKKNIELPEIFSLSVKPQINRIDISIIVNGEYLIIIEDKIHSKTHGNQLERYYKIAQKNYPDDKIIPIFLKTSYEAHYNIGNYYLFLLNDFIEVIELGKKLKVQNPIFTDFAEILTQRAIGIEEYKDLPVNEWRNGWIGFFKDIQNSIKTEWLNWGFVQNQNGGFWGMWGHFYEINYNNVKKIHFLLKQINENDDASIYFFIEPQEIEGIARKELKYKWADKFIEAGKKIGGEVVKVRRFGEGKNMAVAQYEGKVIFMGEDGKFIKDKTIEVLEKCKKIIEIASE